jgi:ribosomal protein S18 acetylase RimI-like enzyme
MPARIRRATPDDAEAAAPLVYSSGPAAFDYVFSVPGTLAAADFLHRAFVDGRGEFGYRNHVVAELDGVVVGVGAAWSAAANLGFALAAARQILGGYGPSRGIAAMVRGLRVESVIQPPRRGAWYVAHLGVQPDVRSRGIGETLVRHLVAEGRDRGCATAELDVATTNPRAEALYARLGFVVSCERDSRLGNAQGRVANHRRMVLPLTA